MATRSSRLTTAFDSVPPRSFHSSVSKVEFRFWVNFVKIESIKGPYHFVHTSLPRAGRSYESPDEEENKYAENTKALIQYGVSQIDMS